VFKNIIKIFLIKKLIFFKNNFEIQSKRLESRGRWHSMEMRLSAAKVSLAVATT
jgi:hypothetical protein